MRRQWSSRATVIEAIHAFVARERSVPTWDDFQQGRHGLPRPQTVYRFFPTGRVEAIRAAGLECQDQRPWTTRRRMMERAKRPS